MWIPYNNKDLLEVWKYLTLSESHESPSWKFDCVNIPRQCLDNAFGRINKAMLEAYNAGNVEKVDSLCTMMSELLDDVDRLVASDSYFLLGKWIEDARAFGIDEAEKDYYERDARNILSTWGGRDQKLNDYANRTYAGLIADYYKPRWEMYFKALRESLANGTSVDEQELLDQMLDFEWAWVARTDKYTSTPVGDPAKLCTELYQKWNKHISDL